MNNEFSLQAALNSVLDSLMESMAGFLPKALTALTVFLVGFILAKVAAKAITTVFDKLRLNDVLQRVGLTDTLEKFGLTETPGFLLSRLVYYLILALFIQSAAQAVGLVAVSDAVTAFFAYLPNLLAAAVPPAGSRDPKTGAICPVTGCYPPYHWGALRVSLRRSW